MVMSEHSTVVGVFTDDSQAEQAIEELIRVGFSDDEISVSKSGAATGAGGVIGSLKNLFSGKETTTATTADDFVRMGVLEQDAGFYQTELEAGRTIVLVRAADLQQPTLGILRRYGAYDVTTRRP